MLYTLFQSSFRLGDRCRVLDTQGQFADRISLHAFDGGDDHPGHTRSEDTTEVRLQLGRYAMDSYGIMVTQLQANNPIERRIVKQLSFGYLMGIECIIIMCLHHLEHFVRGIKGLDKHFPFGPFSSRTSCHLFEHLISPLVGAEVGLVKERIGIEYRHQTHIIEMETFGDHLRSDENIAFVVREGIDDILVCGFITRRIEVHTHHTCLGEERLYLILDTLGSKTDGLVLASTNGTDGRYGSVITAVMTTQFVFAHVQRHRHVALDTTRRLTAVDTLYLRRITASVLEEDDLFMLRQTFSYTSDERITEMPFHLFSFVLTAKINERDSRQFDSSESLGERHQTVRTFLRQIIRLHRRCRCS